MSTLRSSIRESLRNTSSLRFLTLTIIAAIVLLAAAQAIAIDGNYASPYASQWDTRSAVATLPDETLIGLLLLALNFFAAAYFHCREVIRRRRQST